MSERSKQLEEEIEIYNAKKAIYQKKERDVENKTISNVIFYVNSLIFDDYDCFSNQSVIEMSFILTFDIIFS